ncbi:MULTISPECIES: DUF2188 domain-containing protein [unclassified Cupriavidus]|uniref:DUF2188 domain-containing protein n=1 Tax=unclassified Cupriavidus TaxID=2640874 RepID=UPI001AE44A1E|nr:MULTISPECIES: DUF2188 domain-containing protein [unclassified Cupriavidus]MBP0629700.1 DUF2188 domain-containing protein [Cupriavidus sp. AcVe19-1a]MBP0636726.1 DUF2188 domain-containing protein [Cupriavidus sp. AcVe19-6a]
MQSRIIRVLPAEHGWALEFTGLDIKPQRFPTMEAAIAAGWDVARRQNAELHIHRHDGNVQLRSARDGKQQDPQR